MIDIDDLTLSYNSEAKCPYCGFEDYDSWELEINEEWKYVTACHSSGKDYGVMKNIEITYSTWALDKDEEGGDKDGSKSYNDWRR